MKIIKLANLVDDDLNNFNMCLINIIDGHQSAGLEVEVQYQTSVLGRRLYYSALVLGRGRAETDE